MLGLVLRLVLGLRLVLVFTAGCMGVGKGHTLTWLHYLGKTLSLSLSLSLSLTLSLSLPLSHSLSLTLTWLHSLGEG
jgi:hypothetical protein